MPKLTRMIIGLVLCAGFMGPLSAEDSPIVVDEAFKAAVREQVTQDAAELEAQARAAQKEQEMLDQTLDNLKGLDDLKFAMENKVCPVTGKTFGPDFPYVEVEWEGGVYRVCKDGCKEQFEADPGKYAAIVDKEVGPLF